MHPTHADKVNELAAQFPELHPSTLQIVPYFEFGHLPEHLAMVSAQFYEVVMSLLGLAAAKATFGGPELTVALRKLLEAKDAAVRAAV